MQKDSRLCWLEKYQGIVYSIVFYFFIQPEDVFSGRDDALAPGASLTSPWTRLAGYPATAIRSR